MKNLSLISRTNRLQIKCNMKSDKTNQKPITEIRRKRMKDLSARFEKYKTRDKEFLDSRTKEMQNLIKDFGLTDFMLLKDIVNKKIESEDITENTDKDHYNLATKDDYIRDE